MSSTLRPSRPPLALMSSRQTSIPSCEALPPPARPPVCAIDMPILIGGCCASAREPCPTTATAIAPPRNVLRSIVSPHLSLLSVIYGSAGSAPGRCDWLVSNRDYLAPTGVG